MPLRISLYSLHLLFSFVFPSSHTCIYIVSRIIYFVNTIITEKQSKNIIHISL